MAIECTPADIQQFESDMQVTIELQRAASQRRAELVRSLRDAADFFEAHPLVQTPRYTVMNVFLNTKDEIAGQARLATWEKDYQDTWFCLRKTFCEDLKLEINTQRSTVCRKVVTGTEVVPLKPAEPASVRETFEWVCDEPLLAVRS